MSSNIPNKIYRYQSFNALSLDALCHDQLYFSDPAKFNDPLDCKPSVEQDSDKETLQLTLKALIKKRVEMEVLTSLKAAKAGGDNAKAHAQRQAQQTADNG